MNRRNFMKAGIAVGIGLSLPKGVYAKLPPPPKVETPPYLLDRKVTSADRQAAADRARSMGIQPGVANQMAIADIPGVPHYFGPYANYANSPMPVGPIGSITLEAGGSGYTAPLVAITDVYGTSTNALATAVLTGDVITAITLDDPGSGYTAPVVTITDPTGTGAVATAALDLNNLTGGIRKFMDPLPGLVLPGQAAVTGNYIAVAEPDTTSFPGSDYYEIEVNEYTQQFHSELPPTKVRGYRQVNTADANAGRFNYLGPIILSQRDRAVRVKFINNLPTGAGGDLFIPVDETVMGAGEGPTPGEKYKQNRATLHLHGGLTPWISDGTPHQWTVPAGEGTAYPIGDSTVNVPDMPDPGDGAITFYWTNQQSARLMFYHDHAYGITRLNVYAGEAAGYLITDTVEDSLMNGTVTDYNPDGLSVLPGYGIPLILQDKTFVDAATIAAQDPNWLWGGWGSTPGTGVTGDLWLPNVYMPAQNPWDPSGANAFGRWQYGPWFWPPVPVQPDGGALGLTHGPIPNEYFDNYATPWEPPMRPDMPNPSMGMEAFNDTPIVNGVAYPYLEVQPTAVRFRILNAANDRFFNLHFYVADPEVLTPDGRVNTEVKMVPAMATPGFPATWSTDGRAGGVPDPATMGPDWIVIGTEGGFLPEPVVVPPQPINWNMNATAFNVGNVTDHSLLVGCAERMDVIVDFSGFAGKTLIMYNDAPAAFPALDPRYDYYTGCPDQMDTGGAPSTKPGYGPNTRTVMQIRVGTLGGATGEPLADVTVTNGGADYTSVPEVVIEGGGAPTTPAVAHATGGLDHITVVSGGSGYTSAPTVDILGDGSGAAATAIIKSGRVTGIVVTNPGMNYTTAPTVTLTGGGATVDATVTAALTITGIVLDNPGDGYTSLPTVSIVGGGGYGATAVATFASGAAYDLAALQAVWAHNTALAKPGVFESCQDPIILPQAAYNSAYGTGLPESQSQYVQLHEFTKTFFNGPLTGLTLTAGGTGYTSAPTVTISGGGATLDATATAAITGAFVNAVTVTNGGSGYTSTPTVTLVSNDTGAGATAIATTTRIVASVNVTNGGTGYTSAPTVRFNGGGGGGAAATAVVSGGAVVQVIVTAGGSYTGTPTISFQGGGGRNAAASAVMTRVVSGVTVTNGGAGYGVAPTVTFTGGGGSGAAATATVLPGFVSSLTLDTPGAGYVSEPTVAFTGGGGTGAAARALGISIAMEPKAIHDEMGAAYDVDYGRMGGLLGLELPVVNSLNQNMVLYGYASPPVDLLKDSLTPLGTTEDGTQIWKITQNGVDTHPIHFHLVNVQLINRVAWDGAMLPPHPFELGWKETVRVNPLEHCIVAMRPVAPKLPFEVPNSLRKIDVTMPEGVTLRGGPQGFVDPGGTAAPIVNHIINFGWEFVWHCHILSHEEMDMMHALSFGVKPAAPTNLAGTYYNTGPRRVALSWVDNAVNDTSFTVQRAVTPTGPWVTLSSTVPAQPGTGNTVTYNDTTVARNRTYYYRVMATNTLGDTTVYAAPAIGYPTLALNSDPTPVMTIVTSATGAVGTFIFANAFDAGVAGWAGMFGNVAFIPAAAMGGVGGLGMAANVGAAPAGAGLMSGADPTPIAAYVYDTSPDNETVYDASFFFNPNGFESGDSPVDVFVGLDQESLPVFGIQYEKEGDEQELRAWVLQGGKQVFTQSVKVADGEHLVELAWVSDAKAKFSLFLDEKLVGTVTGDTSGHLLNEILMGVVTGVSKSTSGSMYFDEFTSSRTLGVTDNKVFLPWLNK